MLVLGVLSLVAAFSFAFSPALAANCGGPPVNVPCQCGDTVTADYTLPGNLTCATTFGLKIATDVTLDGAYFTVTGSGAAGTQGILFSNVDHAVVQRIGVTGWERGIQFIAGADNNQAIEVVAFNNGTPGQTGFYGIDFRGANTTLNKVIDSVVDTNGDEGVHFGAASIKNYLQSSEVYDNFREQVYVIDSNTNQILDNPRIEGGTTSLYVKNSKSTLITGNTFKTTPVIFTGGANANTFGKTGTGLGNTIIDARLEFQQEAVSGVYKPAFSNTINQVVISNLSGNGCVNFKKNPASPNSVKLPYGNKIQGTGSSASTLSCGGSFEIRADDVGMGTPSTKNTIASATKCNGGVLCTTADVIDPLDIVTP